MARHWRERRQRFDHSVQPRIGFWGWIERLTYLAALIAIPFAYLQIRQGNATDKQIGELLGYTQQISISTSKLEFLNSEQASQIYSDSELRDLIISTFDELRELQTSANEIASELADKEESQSDILVFEEDFNSQNLDVNKWTIYCDPSEYKLVEGQLSITVSEDGHESCIFKPKLPEDLVVSKISYDVTVSPGTNTYGWIGLFTWCGNLKLNVSSNSISTDIVKTGQPQKLIVNYSALPESSHITFISDSNDISVTSETNVPDISTVFRSHTTCFADIFNIRIGSDRRSDLEGTINGLIDNLKIQGIVVTQ